MPNCRRRQSCWGHWCKRKLKPARNWAWPVRSYTWANFGGGAVAGLLVPAAAANPPAQQRRPVRRIIGREVERQASSRRLHFSASFWFLITAIQALTLRSPMATCWPSRWRSSTALHWMPGGLVTRKPSVCQTRGLWENGIKICPNFYTIRKITA